MSTIDAPAWLRAAALEWSLERATAQNTSDLTKASQVVDLYSWAWKVAVTCPGARIGSANAGRFEALVNLLAGGSNSIRLHHLARPVPFGTMRGSPTVAAAALQFADSLTIAGAWDTARQNLFPHSENLASWTNFALGCSLGAANSLLAPDGLTTAEVFTEDTSTGNHGLDRYHAYASVGLHSLSSHFHVGSGDRFGYLAMIAGGGVDHRAWFNLQAGSVSLQRYDSSTRASMVALGGGWYRCAISANIANTTAPIQRAGMVKPGTSNTFGDYVGNGSSSLGVWGLHLQPGELTDYIPTATAGRFASGSLAQGDFIGVNGQLLQAASDSLANASGQLVVPLVNRLRRSVGAGAPVIWDRPTAKFFMVDPRARSVYTPGRAGGQAFDLIEDTSA
jgi:hypothetical protein